MNLELSYTAPEESPKITWDTKLIVSSTELIGWRYINGKPHKLVIPLSDSVNDLFIKVNRIVQIDDELFTQLSDIAKRVREDSDDTP